VSSGFDLQSKAIQRDAPVEELEAIIAMKKPKA
jgi:hypothetical protein